MRKRDADIAEILSQFGGELQHCHLLAEGQSDEFQHYQAELRQHLARSNTEGEQFRSQYQENRTANAGVAPEVTRFRVRDYQLVTDVSTLQKSRDGIKESCKIFARRMLGSLLV